MRRIALSTTAVLIGLGSLGCSSQDKTAAGTMLTPEEIAERVKNEREDPLDVAGRSQLVIRLHQTLTQWYSAQFSARTAADRELARNLSDVLHATVYKHYPDVLEILLRGDSFQKTVTAAAIGFARSDAPRNDKTYSPAAISEDWKSAVDPLIELLSDPDPKLQQNALLGLWRLHDPETPLEPILKLLIESPHGDVRANAALALSSILTPETGARAIDVLLTSTNDVNPRVRVQAVTALGATKHPAAAGRLLKLLDDPYELIQANAARALGLIGDKKNAGALVTHLERLVKATPTGKFRDPTDVDSRRELLKSYLIESLQVLSGERYGDDVEDWRDWWDDELKNL